MKTEKRAARKLAAVRRTIGRAEKARLVRVAAARAAVVKGVK